MIIETGLYGGDSRPPCLLDSFTRSVARRPADTAVVDSGHRLTYRELNGWIARIAELLRVHGVTENDTVAVTGQRSAAVVAAMFAVVGVGATYLPLDGRYPRRRLNHMLAETGATLLLHTGPDPELPAPRSAAIPAWQPADGAAPFVATTCRLDQPVYIIYTSGSTGRPKGVVVPHRSVDNMADWQRHHSVREGLRTAQFAPLNFDIFFQEVFSTLGGGGSLVIMPEELRQDPIELLGWLRRERIERLFLPCVALHMLATAATAVDSLSDLTLREINTAGEQLVCTPAIKELFARLPSCRLNNHYGQSESHTVSVHTLTGPSGSWPDLSPIGRPLPGCEILLDADPDNPRVGELLVAGHPLSTGYLNQPELTAQRYVAVGPTAHGQTRAFRTGDLVSVENGLMHFLGRTDDEVKIRGYRVNPLEVEAHLGKLPGVVEAICVQIDRGPASRQLRAAVTVGAGEHFDPAAALASLRAELPAFCVPASIAVLPAMPRTATGKADRAEIARQLAPRQRGATTP